MTDSLVLFTFAVAYIFAGIALLAVLGGVTFKPRLQPIPIRIDRNRPQGNRPRK